MAKNAATLHDTLEGLSPKGVGVGISLPWLERACAKALDALMAQPRKGVTEQIPLPGTATIQAAFRTRGKDFHLDVLKHTISLSLQIFLHGTGKPTESIYHIEYEIKDADIDPQVDQATLELFLQPKGTISSAPTGHDYDKNAAPRLIKAGYKNSDGTPDYARFEREVLYPFLWLNARGLVLAVFRSLPMPPLLMGLNTIRPVVPVLTALKEEYLLAWTEEAFVELPTCGATQSPSGPPTTRWQLAPNSPAPSSPFDNSKPPFALYFAAGALLRWHADVLMPAVMVSQTQQSFVGWRYDAAIGLHSLIVELRPSTSGGSIVAKGDLKIVGVASVWINGPCGVKFDLITGAIQGDGTADATLIVTWDAIGHQVKAALSISGDINRSSVNIIGGGLFGSILGDLVEWLYKIGVIRINTQYQRRSDTTLLDATGLLPLVSVPRTRIGRASALIACFADEGRKKKRRSNQRRVVRNKIAQRKS